MRVGLFPMVADILHAGHILAIEEAKQNCDYLIVALHCNPVYKEPIQSVFERYVQLKSVKYVDEVIPYNDVQDAALMITSLNYDVYFLGEDHKDEDFECKGILDYLGKELYYLRRQHTLSSTDLKNRMIRQDAEETTLEESDCG